MNNEELQVASCWATLSTLKLLYEWLRLKLRHGLLVYKNETKIISFPKYNIGKNCFAANKKYADCGVGMVETKLKVKTKTNVGTRNLIWDDDVWFVGERDNIMRTAMAVAGRCDSVAFVFLSFSCFERIKKPGICPFVRPKIGFRMQAVGLQK